MPLILTPITNDNFIGYTIEIHDIDKLANLVSKLLASRYLHVMKILKEDEVGETTISDPVFEQIVGYLDVPALDSNPTKNTKRYHRDGWIFQMISWIALHESSSNNTGLSIPHYAPAKTGFDALAVNYGDGAIGHVLICEDKAAEESRRHVRDNVWSEFSDCESGKSDRQLISDVCGILSNIGAQYIEEIIENINWKDCRRYRVTVTIDDDSTSVQRKIFKGYETCVFGDIERRRADTMYCPDLRLWMDGFTMKILNALKELRGENV